MFVLVAFSHPGGAAFSARREFGMSLLDFADSITPADMGEWSQAVASAQSGVDTESDPEKKSL